MRRGLLVVVATLVAACAPPPGPAGLSGRAPGFHASDVRQPVVLLRVALDRTAFGPREQAMLPSTLEAMLLAGLDARAILPRDARLLVDGALDAAAALARARELGADHAILVDARLARLPLTFCRGAGRAFTATVTRISQAARVLRVDDGAERVGLTHEEGPAVVDLEPDCADPRASLRRSTDALLAEAVDRLLVVLLGPGPTAPRGASRPRDASGS